MFCSDRYKCTSPSHTRSLCNGYFLLYVRYLVSAIISSSVKRWFPHSHASSTYSNSTLSCVSPFRDCPNTHGYAALMLIAAISRALISSWPATDPSAASFIQGNRDAQNAMQTRAQLYTVASSRAEDVLSAEKRGFFHTFHCYGLEHTSLTQRWRTPTTPH